MLTFPKGHRQKPTLCSPFQRDTDRSQPCAHLSKWTPAEANHMLIFPKGHRCQLYAHLSNGRPAEANHMLTFQRDISRRQSYAHLPKGTMDDANPMLTFPKGHRQKPTLCSPFQRDIGRSQSRKFRHIGNHRGHTLPHCGGRCCTSCFLCLRK